MVRVDLRGIHRVKRRLRDRTVREHHYAWRGGPKFWSSESEIPKGSAAYVAALANATTVRQPAGEKASRMVDRYLDSAEFRRLAPRTQSDYRKWALRFADEFKDDPAQLFEDPESRGEVSAWRQRWAHSPKQYDYAGTVAAVVLNWARDNGIIRLHHCDRLRKLYESDRSEILWSPADLARFAATAPEWVRRILDAAVETGLRPGDLIRLTRRHVEDTPQGQRIRIRTRKKGRIASIPVTPGMRALLDATPASRPLILVSHRGRPLTPHRASEAVKQWRDKAGIEPDADGRIVRLQDARGTAATRLLRAGCSLKQIAAHMGWSLRYAANVIEKYAAVAPEDADEILILLAARKAEGGTKL